MDDPLTRPCPSCGADVGEPCSDLRVHGHDAPRSPVSPHDARRAPRSPGVPFLRVRDAARRLGLHENTIRNMVQDGRLKDVRVPGTGWTRLDARQIAELEAARGLHDDQDDGP